ncbi:MAG: HAD-IA family hydrolase, partial [Candidatus Dormiibacterota bacterium]
TGLAGCFDAVVISGEAGVGKPAPEAFARVLDALGVRAADSVMAGDSWSRDIEGALGAGLAAVWVAGQRTRPEPRPGVRVIASVAELAEPEALRELLPRPTDPPRERKTVQRRS